MSPLLSIQVGEWASSFTDPWLPMMQGTQRFKKNVGNFGNFLEDVQLDVLDFREVEDGLCTRWRFGVRAVHCESCSSEQQLSIQPEADVEHRKP